MSIDPRFYGTVQGFSVAAAIMGLLIGWVPGSDIVGLLALWVLGIIVIVSEAGVVSPFEHFYKLVLITIGGGFVFAAGVELATTITLPVFFIVNPILDYIATYRVLRAAAKLYAKNDSEELFSNVLGSIFTMMKYIVWE